MIDRLYCKNFRRIQEADIEVKDGITVIVGNNGTGKSSLIEVIIFNLFGKVKGGTKKDSVRRKGAAEDDPTFTVIDFTLNDIHYRCRRYYTKKMSLMATLYAYTDDEYEKLKQQDDITELDKELGREVASSTSAVASAVEEILGVSYDGFKASFIAQQKELDALASLTLENRKKFFLDLLGYSRLDDIKPEISRELKGIQNKIDILERQNLSVPEITKEIEKLEKQVEIVGGRIVKGRETVGKTSAEAKVLSDEYMAAKGSADIVKSAESEIALLAAEKEELAPSIANLTASIETDRKVSEGYDENSSLSDRISRVKQKVSDAYAYVQAKQSRERFSANVELKQKQFADNAAEIARLAERTAKEPDVDTAQAELTTAKEAKASAAAKEKEAEKRLSSMKGLLGSVEAGEVAKCPTCGNEIASENGKQHLGQEIGTLSKEQQEASDCVKTCDNELAKKEQRLSEVKALARSWQKDLNEKTKLEQRNELLAREIADAKEQEARFLAEEKRLEPSQMSNEQQREAEHQLNEMQEALKRKNEMKAAFYRVRQNEGTLRMSKQRLQSVQKALAEKEALVKENKRQASRVDGLLAKKKEKEEALEKYRNKVTELEREHAAAQASLKAAQGNLSMAKRQSEQLSDLKDGIEAHIGAQQVVEFLRKNLPSRIAPRLALEASHLLEIATSGAYNMIEIDETYEVYIYTDDDVRPIAMMSGGEADVIALCIRIAIAKLILEATGIETQTFILDEIFGALDDSRKESTCIALQNIGSQLSRILCITHIDEIKDMADWTYAVEMDENGVSHVREIVDAPLDAAEKAEEPEVPAA